MSNRSQLVFADIEGVLEAETENAIGIKCGADEMVWIPKSQLGHITYEDGDSFDVRINENVEAVEIPVWLAREKGLDFDN